MNSAEQKIIDAFRVFFTEGQAVGSYIAGHLQAGSAPVSYTHLTLPTICSV